MLVKIQRNMFIQQSNIVRLRKNQNWNEFNKSTFSVFGGITVAMCFIRFSDECRGSVFQIRHAFFFVFILVQTYTLVKTCQGNNIVYVRLWNVTIDNFTNVCTIRLLWSAMNNVQTYRAYNHRFSCDCRLLFC